MVFSQVVRIGPHEWAALVRFGVDRFAFPVGGNEERAESRSSGTSIVVDDGGEAERVGVDGDADFFSKFAGRAWWRGSPSSRWPEGRRSIPSQYPVFCLR